MQVRYNNGVKQQIITLIGKGVRKASQLKGGGGSALPGLIIERIDPSFLKNTLSQLPHGTVLISGTNGKTTTTKMVVELLESQGIRVFTNRTGSNFTRGIVAALVESVDNKGVLPFDIAVLELDEAYAVKFSTQIKPRYSLFLNVLRDQLDRFGEIDATAQMLHSVAIATRECVIINSNDPRLASATFQSGIEATIKTYGTSESIAHLFPADDQMRANNQPIASKATSHQGSLPADTYLDSFENSVATIVYSKKPHNVELKLKGIFNILNATAAVATVRAIMGKDLDEPAMLNSLSQVTPAFGRGEDIIIHGQPVELVLVKNPSGFRLSLASFSPDKTATMIAINDNYADGRDMSWLWDVDFESLAGNGVATVSGIRAFDMALRLQYDEVEVKYVEPNLPEALEHFLTANQGSPKRIYCTYTAMLTLRKQLSKITSVEKIL